ncbi:ash family protein [Salmonella enterica subsp. diarizonae serovar 53:r:z35]|nr:ash family protein [Salmonella enterica subsp. diarizonae serovar 53:r:z35]
MATPQCNQTRPKFQYRFMALDRADRQAKPCPANGQWGSYQPLNIFLQNFAICHLPLHTTACYRNSALYKTSAGIETPCKLSATPDAASVFFVVCHTSHSMAWCAHLMTNSPQAFDHATAHHAAHNGAMCSYSAGLAPSTDTLNSTPRRQRMVTLAGQPQGWPVSDNTGSLNPVNVTATIEIETSSGDSVNLLSEAAVMVATPARTRPKFIFRFWSPHFRMRDIIATTEKQARSRLRRPKWEPDERYPIPVTGAVYQVLSHLRYTDGRSRDYLHPEMYTSRRTAEELATRAEYETDYVTVTTEVVEVHHV